MKIGVFDSGVGGLSVAQAIVAAHPEHEIVFKNDSQHVPYGNKSPEVIKSFVVPIFQSLVDQECRVIVVACNTVTTTLIDDLRAVMSIPLVAVEPMVKPAAEMTKTGVIAVCATPTTLASPRYKWLKQQYAAHITVLEPDCSDWSSMIEHDLIDDDKILERIQTVLKAGADIIVLGCTHYHWIEEKIRIMAQGKATVLQPEAALIAQLERVIQRLDP